MNQNCTIRINPNKITKALPCKRIAWSEYGYILPQDFDVSLDPLFYVGAYVRQTAEDMFIEQIIRPLNTKPLRVFDLCAGEGKISTHIISILQRGSILLSNEFDAEKAQNLSENLIKWGKSNCIVCNNSFEDFNFLENYFDVTVISQNLQKETFDCAYKTTKKGGIIILISEDEQIPELNKSELKSLPIPINNEWGVMQKITNDVFSYKVTANKTKYFYVFKKECGDLYKPPKRFQALSISIIPEHSALNYSNLIKNYRSIVYEVKEGVIWSFAENYGNLLFEVFNHLKIIHAGIPLVEVKKNKMNPRAGLACANSFKNDILPQIEISKEQAFSYLKGENILIENAVKGLNLVTYKGVSISFLKSSKGKIHNPFPKEWQIKTQKNPSAIKTIFEL